MPELPYFDPSLVIDYLNILTSCDNVVCNTQVMVEGLAQLGTLSANRFLRTFCRFFLTGLNPNPLENLFRRYIRAHSSGWVNFGDLPFRHTRPSSEEHIQLAG